MVVIASKGALETEWEGIVFLLYPTYYYLLHTAILNSIDRNKDIISIYSNLRETIINVVFNYMNGNFHSIGG